MGAMVIPVTHTRQNNKTERTGLGLCAWKEKRYTPATRSTSHIYYSSSCTPAFYAPKMRPPIPQTHSTFLFF